MRHTLNLALYCHSMADSRTFRVPVRFVSAVDGEDLPLSGYILVPEDRLNRLEAVASSSWLLLDRAKAALRDVKNAREADAAKKKLEDDLEELARVWDIPQA